MAEKSFKSILDQSSKIEDDAIYDDWSKSVVDEARANSPARPLSLSMKDAPKLEPIDDSFLQKYQDLGYDKDLVSQVYNHYKKYDGLHDIYGQEVENVANLYGGFPVGLEFRRKTPASLLRKLQKEVDEQRAAGNPNFGYQDAIANLKDLARYTIVYDSDRFQDNVYNTINYLKNKGYQLSKFKNSFQEGEPYKGLNTNFRDKNGNIFELQFHLPNSIRTKEGIDVDLTNRTAALNLKNITSSDIYHVTRKLETKINTGTASPQEIRLYNVLITKAKKMWEDIPNYELDYKI